MKVGYRIVEKGVERNLLLGDSILSGLGFDSDPSKGSDSVSHPERDFLRDSVSLKYGHVAIHLDPHLDRQKGTRAANPEIINRKDAGDGSCNFLDSLDHLGVVVRISQDKGRLFDRKVPCNHDKHSNNKTGKGVKGVKPEYSQGDADKRNHRSGSILDRVVRVGMKGDEAGNPGIHALEACKHKCRNHRDQGNVNAVDRHLVVECRIQVLPKPNVGNHEAGCDHDHGGKEGEYSVKFVVPIMESAVGLSLGKPDAKPHSEGNYRVNERMNTVGRECEAPNVKADADLKEPNTDVHEKGDCSYKLPLRDLLQNGRANWISHGVSMEQGYGWNNVGFGT